MSLVFAKKKYSLFENKNNENVLIHLLNFEWNLSSTFVCWIVILLFKYEQKILTKTSRMLKAAKKMNKYRFPKNKYASSIPTNITIEIQIETNWTH